VQRRRTLTLTALAATLAVASAALVAAPANAAGEFDPYIVSSGDNDFGQRNIPPIPSGVTVTKVVTGQAVVGQVTWVLTSDGNVLTTSTTEPIPALPAGTTYTDITSEYLLRSDGAIVSTNFSAAQAGPLPAAPAGTTYAKIFSGGDRPAAILSDGRAVMFRFFDDGDDDLPAAWISTITTASNYTGIAVGSGFALLSKTDGSVKAVNRKDPNPDDCEDGNDSCDPEVDPAAMSVPKLPAGLSYTSVAANGSFAVLVRSDGAVKTTGDADAIHATLSKLPDGVRYKKVAVTGSRALFLLTNGDVYLTGTVSAGSGGLDKPTIAKNNRFTDIAAGGGTNVFIAQKLTPNVKVQTSIVRVTKPSSVNQGSTATVKVKVYSMATTRGGVVKVTYKNKTIATGTVGDGAIATIKVPTSAMKASGKNKIGISFLGTGNAKKSLSNTRYVGYLVTK
jgi:hypothetical protein